MDIIINIERPSRDSSEQIIVSPFLTLRSNLPKFRFLGEIVPLIVSSIHLSILKSVFFKEKMGDFSRRKNSQSKYIFFEFQLEKT